MYFLIWFVLEFLLFIQLCDWYGFINIFLLYAIPTFIGLFLLRYYGVNSLISFQQTISAEKKPERKLLHILLKTVSSLLLIIPTVLTRFIGLILLLPGFRHLLVFFLVYKWFQLITQYKPGFKNFTFKMGPGFYSTFRTYKQTSTTQTENEDYSADYNIERDAQVIDVTPHLLANDPTKNSKNKN